jgi:hypothetical protein
MHKRKNALGIITVLLVVSAFQNWRLLSGGNVRTVEFISILALGALIGLLISQVIALIKKKE